MQVFRTYRVLGRLALRPRGCAYSHRTFSQSVIGRCSCSEILPKPLNPTTPDPPAPPADHRALGASLDLFSTTRYSPGSPLLHADGSHVFLKLQAFLRAQYAAFGFKEVISPIIYKQSLWELSGHWENYKDDMFEVTGRGVDGKTEHIGQDEKYGLKPMNCPGHCLLYKTKVRSYRDLPVRFADFSPLHRNEISGALSGLTRVRRFHQDDGHIFCRPSQVGEEIQRTLQFIGLVYDAFGLGPYKLVLSTRPKENYIGNVEEWDRAEEQLRDVLEKSGRDWMVNEGDGAFYGPKIDIILKDSDGKEHQTATIQLDFQLPQKFELSYEAPAPDIEVKGMTTTDPEQLKVMGKVAPVLIHRAILGSLERFMALLIEHFKGHWPFWLSPKQLILVTVNDQHQTVEFAQSLAAKLRGDSPAGLSKLQPMNGPQRFQVDVDSRASPVARKIAEAKQAHYNLIAVIGPKELRGGPINVNISGRWKAINSEPALKEGKERSESETVKLSPDELSRMMQSMCDKYL